MMNKEDARARIANMLFRKEKSISDIPLELIKFFLNGEVIISPSRPGGESLVRHGNILTWV